MLFGAIAWVACQPQEIYLFEDVAVDAGRGSAGSAGAPSQPEAPAPRTPPACESAACQECQDSATCAAASNLFCHPRTGQCALGCDPEAADQGVVCPLNQVCHPIDRLCVDCATSADCTTAGLRACDVERGRCVECTATADCTGPRSVCDTDAQRCVECLGEEGCGLLDVCNDATQQCVECVSPADCTADDDARFCFQARCVECRIDADCTEPDRPICSDEFECEDED